MSKVIVIIGAGEGISKSVAEKFGTSGFSVALISRRKDKLEKLAAGLREKGIDAQAFVGDAGDAESMKDAFDQVWEKFNDIDVVHYNAARVKQVSIENETADSLTRDFKVNVGGIMTVLKMVLPDMEKKNEGTILLTGGGFALHPDPKYGSLAIGKAGVRNLAQSLHAALKPKNIFVGTVTVAGFVNENDEKHNPSKIADQFWKLYTERGAFEIQY
jgi:NADP-dependent 3-hydroxy acid dehydrogenase YdfG